MVVTVVMVVVMVTVVVLVVMVVVLMVVIVAVLVVMGAVVLVVTPISLACSPSPPSYTQSLIHSLTRSPLSPSVDLDCGAKEAPPRTGVCELWW